MAEEIDDKPEEIDDYNTIGVWFPSEYRIRCPHCKLFTWYHIPEPTIKCAECGEEIQAVVGSSPASGVKITKEQFESAQNDKAKWDI